MFLPVIPIVFFLVFGILVAVMSRRAVGNGKAGSDPTCGKCGYCVRGISELICPECGSDLREVGIRAPGVGAPVQLTPRAKLIMWSTLVPVICLSLFIPLGVLLGPRVLLTTQRRTIFCQASYLNATLNVVREGRKVAMGVNRNAASPLQTMTISSSSMNPIEVDLASGSAKFNDSKGSVTEGAFNAALVQRWLNAYGYNDPRVAERADDIVTAIKDMDTATSPGFLRLGNDPTRANMPSITAHPSFANTRSEAGWMSFAMPLGVTALVWLVGLPFFLKGRKSAGATPSDPA